MKNTKTIFLRLFIFFLLPFSCFTTSDAQNYYYIPNDGATLALSEKNSLKFSYAVEDNDGINGKRLIDYLKGRDKFTYNLAFGYSPIKHLGIQSSFFKHSRSYYTSVDGHFVNVAGGAYYFKPTRKFIPRKKDIKRLGIRSGLLFDGYVGWGRGEINNIYESLRFYSINDNNPKSQFNFLKTYAQLGIHWQGRIVVSYIFTLAHLNYTKGHIIKHSDILFEQDKIELDNILFHSPFILQEHTLKVHFGSRYIRFFGLMTLKTPDPLNGYATGILIFGSTIHIDKFYTEKISRK